jgi:Zn-dependent metalloprotease
MKLKPPAMTQTGWPVNMERVTTAQHTFKFTIFDDNGVDSAWYTFDGSFVGEMTHGSGDNYSCSVNFGTNYGERTVKIFAKDGSSGHNQTSATVKLTYNTKISAVSNTSPNGGATNVVLKPTFTWSGGNDPDGDNVTYKVHYGTSATNLIKHILH